MKKNKTKYILSMGLAFAEQKDMNKLSALSAQGWLMERFSLFGFIVRKGPAHRLTYCLDIQDVGQHNKDEYREMFAAGGWTYVCSSGNLHMFSAEPGTVPIHTDRTTLYDKYHRITRSSKMFAIFTALITVLTSTLLYLSHTVWEYGLLQNITFVALILCAMLLVPSLMVFTAYAIRLKALSD